MKAQPTLIALGRIIGVHGVRGWVKIHSECRPRETIFNYSVFQATRHHHAQTLKLLDARRSGKSLIALFADICDRDAALQLNGFTLNVTRADLPQLKNGQYYWTDVLGLTVINRSGEHLGKVCDIFETGANDVIVINKDGQEYLIPFISERYIDRIDFENKYLYVDWQMAWTDDAD